MFHTKPYGLFAITQNENYFYFYGMEEAGQAQPVWFFFHNQMSEMPAIPGESEEPILRLAESSPQAISIST